jgi:hypothetical protein
MRTLRSQLFAHSITANAELVMGFASCPLLNGGVTWEGDGGTPGAKTRQAMVEQRTCANFVGSLDTSAASFPHAQL